jgi:outer membrane protein assembly factor BamE (lipoprotein component of BamABCDE complex)
MQMEVVVRNLLSLAALSLLVGCASAGTQVDPAKVATFQRGHTTAAEVQAVLGPPNTSTVAPDGSIMFVYVHARSQVRAATFIPYIGPFVGGADVSSQMVSFTFSPDGVLRGGSNSATQIGSGMGLTAR